MKITSQFINSQTADEQADLQLDYQRRLSILKTQAGMISMIDHLILEGAQLELGFFVFLLNSARTELVSGCERLLSEGD